MDSSLFLATNVSSMELFKPKQYLSTLYTTQKMLTYTLNLDSKELCTYIPPDTILVSAMEGNYFFLHQDLVISPPSLIKIISFKQYINTLP